MGFTYTFKEDDNNKSFNLSVNYNDLSESIIIHCRSKIEIGEDPVEEGKISGSFPTGLSDSYFSIIYHTYNGTTADYAKTLDIDELNNTARIYLQYIYPNSNEDYSNKNYYGQDDNGIYVVIPVQNSDKKYNNELYQGTEDNPISYKVYLCGTCDVVDIGVLPNNVKLTLANGYYYDIENTLYLFLNTNLNMVCFSTDETNVTDYKQFWYFEDENNKKSIISNLNYYSDSHYLKHNEDRLTTNLVLDNDAMMINSGVIDLIVTSNNITNIEHFCACSNVETIILSDNLIEIGDYAFANGSLSGTVKMASDISNIERIGRYAFYQCPNIKLFQDEHGITVLPNSIKYIDDYAFYSAPGLKEIDFSNCLNLLSVGNESFGKCGNLNTVTYLQEQIEPDKNTNTRLLYLPPEKGTNGNYVPRVKGHIESVTASYQYNYTDWINDSENESERDERISERDAEDNNHVFKGSGPSVIKWICK